RIQKDIHDTLGLYTTCGIGENPLLAKLAMDNSAKHKKSMLAFWHYLDVPDTIWKIEKLEDVWGINTRTANRLRKIGINNMYDLAHSKPYLLKKEFGIIGEQLLAESWGVDRSIIRQKYHPKSKSYGNSQVLTRDYFNQREIELVIREIGEQVAARIRAHNLRAGKVSLYIGFSLFQLAETTKRGGFGVQRKITPTNLNHDLVKELIALFRENWHRESVRTISVSYTDLSPDGTQQLNMLEDFDLQIKRYKLDHIVDKIRKEHGFTSLVKASSLLKGATAIERSNLVGGHNGGNAYE
ncbi:MAG: nucleotidyltransferase, partial [Lactobacillus paragasseri]|nr:nucleotidyltransferase [Lactobacillus paragasseri]